LENDSYVVGDACEIKKMCIFSEKVAKKEAKSTKMWNTDSMKNRVIKFNT